MAHDEGDVTALAGEILDRLLAGFDDALAEQQIARRVSQETHLGPDHEIGTVAAGLLDRLDPSTNMRRRANTSCP